LISDSRLGGLGSYAGKIWDPPHNI
jgi:hypothetical protein